MIIFLLDSLVFQICYLLISLIILISCCCFSCISEKFFLCVSNSLLLCLLSSWVFCFLPFHLILGLSLLWASFVNWLPVFWSLSSVCEAPSPPCSIIYSHIIKDLHFFPDSWRHRSCFVPTFFLYPEGHGAGWRVLLGEEDADNLGSELFWALLMFYVGAQLGLPTPGNFCWGPVVPWRGSVLPFLSLWHVSLGGVIALLHASELVGEG